MSLPEEWRAIPGHPYYEVSSMGRVRSLDREVKTANNQLRRYRGVPLTPTLRRNDGYLVVRIADRTPMIHHLVMLAFVGPRPDGMDIRHLNGTPTDNRLANLCYGTRSENLLDAVAHGTHYETKKTHCRNGHPYAGENLIVSGDGRRRRCRTCKKAHEERHKARDL